jgi:hypothetical protein
LGMAVPGLTESLSAVKHCDPAASIAVIREHPTPLLPFSFPLACTARRADMRADSMQPWWWSRAEISDWQLRTCSKPTARG